MALPMSGLSWLAVETISSLPPLTTSQAQPLPKRPDARGFKLFLEGVEAAEGGLDVVGEFAGRRAAGFGRHELPEHGVIPMAAAVVAHRAADVVGHRGEVA